MTVFTDAGRGLFNGNATVCLSSVGTLLTEISLTTNSTYGYVFSIDLTGSLSSFSSNNSW